MLRFVEGGNPSLEALQFVFFGVRKLVGAQRYQLDARERHPAFLASLAPPGTWRGGAERIFSCGVTVCDDMTQCS